MVSDKLIKDAQRITDGAVAALWSFYSRPKTDGGKWGDVAGFRTVNDFAASFAERPGKLGDSCRMAMTDPGIRPEEVEALKAYLMLNAAAELAHRR